METPWFCCLWNPRGQRAFLWDQTGQIQDLCNTTKLQKRKKIDRLTNLACLTLTFGKKILKQQGYGKMH